MAKISDSSRKTTELMFLASVLVIVVAGVLIFQHGTRKANSVSAQVEGARTVRLDTPSDMMKALDTTADDGGEVDFLQLKTEASGL